MISQLDLQDAQAQRYGFFAPELRSVPLLNRPNRPGHFIGNAIRNSASRNSYQPPVYQPQPVPQYSQPRGSQYRFRQPYVQPSYERTVPATPTFRQPRVSVSAGGVSVQVITPHRVTVDSKPVNMGQPLSTVPSAAQAVQTQRPSVSQPVAASQAIPQTANQVIPTPQPQGTNSRPTPYVIGETAEPTPKATQPTVSANPLGDSVLVNP